MFLGCPIRQEAEACTIATASGCGLDSGVVDRIAEFVVDVKGECGDLFVDVRGYSALFSICHFKIRLYLVILCIIEIIGQSMLLLVSVVGSAAV